jgi:hypothetical protein
MSGAEVLGRDAAEDAYQGVDNRKDLGDYEYKKDLSDKRAAVYHNPKTNQSHIGFRGTADGKDAFTDVLDPRGNILTGTHAMNPLYKSDVKLYDRVSAQHGGKVTVSGHSLGGSRAEHVSQKRNAEAQTFNLGRGVGIPGIAKQVYQKARCSLPGAPAYCDKITRHHIKGDLLSVADRMSYGKHKNYKLKNPAKAHFMTNFFKQK